MNLYQLFLTGKKVILSTPPIWILVVMVACNNTTKKQFQLLDPEQTNIYFNNKIVESDTINPIDMEFLYNGGGVAAADFNNDNMPDLYFTGSMVSNKLYINKGNFKFKDITEQAGVAGNNKWFNGISVIDINADGKKDIYLCASVYNDPQRRKNILFINQGNNKEGVPVFKDMAEEYGLADTSMSVQAAFLDYDRDGDLDMYLVTTKLTSRNIFAFGGKPDSSTLDYDKLFRNDWNEKLQHPYFTDVSKSAGINGKGYGLGVSIGDVNSDGWPDIYVTNDFITSDHLWINNRNGTFSNRVNLYLKHTSQNAMGNDVVDINNDALPDLIAVDMSPEDNYRRQKNMASTNYAKYRNMLDKGYSIQYVRNTLQINQGYSIGINDSILHPLFSDVSYYAGIASTDWSWTPSVADFDNDGMRDILITNGYPKDVTDHDYISYRKDNGYIVPRKELLKQIPEIKIANYAFKNKGDLQFQDVSVNWGLNQPSFSTGAAYADLDNDGDLDYIISNINETAFVYQNTANDKKNKENNFLRCKFKGNSLNPDGIGATVTVWYNGVPHMYEHYPWRGYLGTVEFNAHFGLGSLAKADSLIVQWPDNTQQIIKSVSANTLITLDINNATKKSIHTNQAINYYSLFTSVNNAGSIRFLHTEYDYIDFDVQRLLPHKLSEYGPALAAGDVNGDELDDLYISGPKGTSGSFLIQQKKGNFLFQPFAAVTNPYNKPWEEMGSLLFDADNDGDNDLYLCSGSNEFKQGDTAFADRFFLNDGTGNFKQTAHAIPLLPVSKDVIKAADFDNDGDLDLFIGSRMIPGEYPKPANGYILRNDTRINHVQFTNVTEQLAPALTGTGMISDAVWSDFDNDGFADLIVCGEFMPIRFFKNTKGRFIQHTTAIDNQSGLWNSITAVDIDNDGDMDYVAGNAGLNSFYKGSSAQPFQVYAADFDKNGSYDAIPFLYLKNEKGNSVSSPAFTRDDMTKQLIRIKGDFPTYKQFAAASLNDILKKTERDAALKAEAVYFQTSIIKNKGNGDFELLALPYQAQLSPVFGILADDFNADGNPDLLLTGNDFGIETVTGQYDALNGLLLSGNGNGSFKPQSMTESGICIPYSGKSLVKINIAGNYTIAAAQNRNFLQWYSLRKPAKIIRLTPDETTVKIYLQNGKIRKEEYYFGSGFLSQQSRFILMNNSITKVELLKNNKINRTILNTPAAD